MRDTIASMNFTHFLKNGALLPLTDATISIENIQFQYGFGVYESLRVRNGVIYFASQHAQRLMESARLIGLEHPYYAEQIVTFITDVVEKNSVQSLNIKILLIGGRTAEESLLFILPLAPLFPDRKLYSKGASVETTPYRRFTPNAKTLNMLPSYLAYTKAQKNGYYDALFVDEGMILEGTRTNFFAIKNSSLITPPKETVLDGVTRQAVIMIARKNGFTVREEKIPFDTLSDFDGAFLTSTSSKIIPLVQIDDFRYKEIPSRLKELMKCFDTFLEDSKGIFPK